jgi:hypothetical protein
MRVCAGMFAAQMDKIDFDDLLSRVKEIEELLQFPSLSGHIERANALAVSVARRAPSPIPHLAMLVADAVNEIRLNPQDREAQSRFRAAIAQLREAIEVKRSQARS